MWPGAPDVAHRVSEELLCGNHPSYVAGPLYCCVETIPPMWRANNLFHIVQASRFFHLDLCARCHNLFLYPVFFWWGNNLNHGMPKYLTSYLPKYLADNKYVRYFTIGLPYTHDITLLPSQTI